MRALKRLYLFLILILPFAASGQNDAMVNSMQQRFALYNERAVQEKMYMHIDRPLYLVGETIWFKAYNLNSTTHRFIDLSKIGYVEVLDIENNPVVQGKFAMLNGKGNGSLVIPATIVSGKYKIRAYTNWMKNFNTDHYFETSIYVINPFVAFDPDRTVKDEGRHDVQFFPEGGHLVQGLPGKVAFRAVSVNGKGVRFQGTVVNQQNETVAEFSPASNGIGHFVLNPKEGETYKAVITDAAGKKAEYPLPAAEPQGYVMQVKDSTDNLIKVTVLAKLESDEPAIVYMLAHTRQLNPVIERKALNRNRAEFVIEKSKLGDGISHITIFNAKTKPVTERLYFKKPRTQLGVAVAMNNKFVTREKVNMELSTTLANANADFANLSVAVYLTDSIQSEPHRDIASYLLLASELKGTIETPEKYFENTGKEADQQIDNLMLTHGWRRFKWDQVFGGQLPAFEYLPEYDGHFITGKILNKADGNPAKGKEVYLAALDVPARLYVTQSDPEGNIAFEVRKFVGPKEVTIQTNLSVDSTYRFEMNSPFSKQFSGRTLSPFYFDKTLENQLLTRSINMQTANAYQPRIYTEKKATLADSLAFFGAPDEKYFLDDFTRFPTMEEVLREYVRGVIVRRRQKEFHFRMVDKLVPNTFYTSDPLVLLDGIPVFNVDKIMEFDPLKIKKIELLSARYFLGPLTFTGIVSFSTYGSDLAGFELDPKVLVLPYEGIQAQREFYAPRYDKGNANSRIADFRNLLHWAPDVTTGKDGKVKLDFYTSDQTGTYQVVVQGITKEGVPGSKTLSFEVIKPNL